MAQERRSKLGMVLFGIRCIAYIGLMGVAIYDVQRYYTAHIVFASIFFGTILFVQGGELYTGSFAFLQTIHYAIQVLLMIVFIITGIGWFEVIVILSIILYFIYGIDTDPRYP